MGTPICTTWVPIRSLWEHFRGFYAIFGLGLFLVFPNRKGCRKSRHPWLPAFHGVKNLLTKDALSRIKKKRGDWTPQSNRLNWSSRVVLDDKNNLHNRSNIMQNTMLDSTVSSDSQELFSDLFRGSDLDDRPPNGVWTKKEAMDST